MTGEKNLEKLLKSMAPELMDGDYVFCSFPNAQYGDHSNLRPLAALKEAEGLTLIIPRSEADENELSYASIFKGITLNVHSSLDAIGLTAAFSSKLSEHGISANVLAGFYHDHIFVQRDDAARAIEALSELTL